MKHIKIFYLLALISFPLLSAQKKDIENYFLKVYENEKLEFLDCVHQEGLELDKQINTKCKISSMAEDAAYFLYDKKSLMPTDFLDQFFRYRSIKKQPAIYPRRAHERGMEGFAIVSFTITETGLVEDAKSIEGWCGYVRNPYTKYKPCNIFNEAALRAAKRLKYEPAKQDGKNIIVKNVLHRFTFTMDDVLTIRNRKSRAYNNVLKAIEKRDFEEAIGIAESNLEFDYIFMNQIANAKYQQGNYLEARNWSNKFKDELLNDQREMPEDIIVRSFMVLISSLFNLGEYEELIKLEPEFNDYIKEREKYNELLAMTNFYFGVSYINTGNINKGAYYLGFAAKNSKSKDQLDYINIVINQVSSYL